MRKNGEVIRYFEKACKLSKRGNLQKAAQLYEKAAQLGHAEAQNCIGRMIYEGNGVSKDIATALTWFTKSAEQGFVKAQYNLGIMYHFGEGVDQDSEKAIYWYTKSAEQGFINAQYNLGIMYKKGEGVDPDSEKAIYWFTKAAEQGFVKAQYNLGLMYEEGEGVDQDSEKALYCFTKAAEQGDSMAQIKLGLMYDKGEGVDQDSEIAIYWFTKAAEQGNPLAQMLLAMGQDNEESLYLYTKSAEQGNPLAQSQLGGMYHKGEGVDQDYEKAIYWFTKAAEQEDAYAQNNLGVMHYNGEGVNQDYEKAIYWYTKAAEQGHAVAQFNLGRMYANGEGVERDIETAVSWYIESANQGFGEAQLLLGLMYKSGDEVKQDCEKAIYWFTKSAEQGYAAAQMTLGIMYMEGDSVERDYKKAVEWFSLAEKSEPDALACYMLGDCYHNGYGVKADWQKAKEYYLKAIELGYNCNYALEMVKVDLGEYSGQSEMRNYADSLIDQGIGGIDRLIQIEKDLKEDFGAQWDKLQDKAKKSLITGVYTYVDYYELGEEYYVDMDFSTAITALCKALEITLAKYFYTGYVRYLKSKNISPSVFPANSCFIKLFKDEEGLEIAREYKDENDTDAFTLGSFYYIIDSKFETKEEIEQRCNDMRSVAHRRHTQYVKEDGVVVKKKGERTISRYMADYADTLFSKDAFGDVDRDRAIVNYLIDLASDVHTVKKQQRNPASHKNLMSCRHAEACGDYLLKVRKIIAKILEKID